MAEYTVKKFMHNGDAYQIVAGCKIGYIDYLLVGGGGGAHRNSSSIHVGGAGGGGVVESFCQAICDQSYSVTIGAGGSGCSKGGDTHFGDIIAYGGGGGGGGSGGSGAGAMGNTGCPIGIACPGQGHNGGSACTCAGGGGGGGGTDGCPGKTGCCAGNGGDGYLSSMSGEACYYAGGGGGNGCQGAGTGGLGGGGNGTRCSTSGNVGATYYGGGGGGSRGSTSTGGGYQGIAIVRYKADGSCGFSSATGGNCCYLCNGYCIHTFTGDGIFTPVF